jgi:putative hydrolase of the HAD superfamily
MPAGHCGKKPPEAPESMIDAFVFDLGNVILRFSHERMCAQMAAVCGVTTEDIRQLLLESGVHADFECGRLTERALHEWLQAQVGRPVDFADLAHAASDIFEPIPETLSVIEALHSAGKRLVLLSNTNVSHFRFVQNRFAFLDRFDAWVLSYKVGAMKPDATIYQAAIAAAGCPAERCFYTDDIPEYVAAARRHGLQAEVFTGGTALRSHLRELGVTLPAVR